MKRALAIVALLVFLAAGAAVYQFRFFLAALAYPERGRALSERAIDAVVSWAAMQRVPAGRVRSLRLPLRLSLLSVTGYVNVARLKDGRTCVLLVEAVGYKDNFEGVLSCSRPLRDSEIVRSDNYPRSFISLSGYGEFEELYISSMRNAQTYDVYFDLN